MAFHVDSSRGKKRLTPSMNVTPLVDVVLVLLIIFMVVTPLLTKRMAMTVPAKPESAEARPPDPLATPPVVLTLAANGALSINREPIARTEVVARLRRMIDARPDKVVFFDAGDEVPYGSAVEVMDLVREGGPFAVAVLPEPVAAR